MHREVHTTWKLAKEHPSCFLHLLSEVGDEPLSIWGQVSVSESIFWGLWWAQHSYRNTEGFFSHEQLFPKTGPFYSKYDLIDLQHQHHLATCEKDGISGCTQTYWIRLCILTRPPGDLCAHHRKKHGIRGLLSMWREVSRALPWASPLPHFY